MTLQQGLAFAVIIGMMVLFVWGRIRYDLIAMLTLLVAVLVGIVPAEEAFRMVDDGRIENVTAALCLHWLRHHRARLRREWGGGA